MSTLHQYAARLAVSLVLIAVVSCGKDHVTNPGPAGPTIVFSSTRTGTFDLYAMYPNGAGLVRLTSDTLEDWEPQWSPSGTKIAFVHRYDPHGDSSNVTVINADGAHPVRLTYLYHVETPSWSPDGSQILYHKGNQYPDPYSVRVVNADGSNDHMLISGDSLNGVSQISWTRQNTLIGVDGSGIVRFNADGSGRTRILSLFNVGYAYPRLSPDGTKIAFAWGGGTSTDVSDIYVVSADGTNLKRLTTNNGSSRPVWSPTGTRIAYVGTDLTMWTMNADGTNQSDVLGNPYPYMDVEGDWK